MVEIGGSFGTPRLKVDASVLKMRGDPMMDSSHSTSSMGKGAASRQRFQSNGFVKDVANFFHLNRRLQSIEETPSEDAGELFNPITT